MTVAKKAPAKAEAVEAKPKAEPVPFEAQEAEYRKPRRPTRAAFSKTTYSVVMLAWYPEKFGDEFDKPVDRDFEPFATEKEARTFFVGQNDWADEDFATNGDMWHATLLLSDSNPDAIVIADHHVIGKEMKWGKDAAAYFKANPEAIFSQTKREAVQEGVKKTAGAKKKAPAKVAPRVPNAKGANVLKEARAAKAAPAADQPARPVAGNRGKALAEKTKALREAKAAEAAAAKPAAPAEEAAPRRRKPPAKAAAVKPAEELAISQFLGKRRRNR